MKAFELISWLQSCDPMSEVIIQKDAEGNGYSPLSGVDPNCISVVVENDMSVYDISWSADDCCMEEHEWAELKKNNSNSVILYPM